jgi:hypothetical protein
MQVNGAPVTWAPVGPHHGPWPEGPDGYINSNQTDVTSGVLCWLLEVRQILAAGEVLAGLPLG